MLLLVAEPWRKDDGGGNTIDNFFSGMDAEFAQVYCSAQIPINTCCRKYYQITDGMVIRNFFNRKPVGRILSEQDYGRQKAEDEELLEQEKRERHMLDIFRNIRLQMFLLAKAVVWRYSKWKTPELERFIKEFDPDVIYAPCYAFPFMLELTKYVKELTGKRVVSWSADDNYSLRQFSLSPFFWINRLWNRHCLKNTYPYYDTFFSISEDEIRELEPVAAKKMRLLRKGINLGELPEVRQEAHTPIRMIYAGGVYINRWKTLREIGRVLKRINENEVKIRLDIYTQNTLNKRQRQALHDGRSIFAHTAVDGGQLKKLYSQSDIALHCESFSLKNRLTTRLSFSTKIIDCLASGCAVMAIAWKEQTGLKYLRSQDAAVCITDLSLLEENLRAFAEHPQRVREYAQKARKCAVQNHDITKIQAMLLEEFQRLS